MLNREYNRNRKEITRLETIRIVLASTNIMYLMMAIIAISTYYLNMISTDAMMVILFILFILFELGSLNSTLRKIKRL